ncbi:MAG: glycerol-3-phosphate acyltransferase [Anaerolineales bacterium]
MILQLIGLAIAGYLLGSIPIAWIVAKLVTGKDLRTLGSGNVGVMNVALSVTRWAGLLVFLSEAAKGVLAVYIAMQLAGCAGPPASLSGLVECQIAIGVTVLATVIGTRWMIWLRFAGGRGNTVGLGAMLVLSWQTLVIGLAIWILVRLIGTSSFWATRISLLTWPIVFGLLTGSVVYLVFGLALSAVYMTTHETVSDDHTIMKERWPSLWAFMIGPKRRRES